MLNSALRLDADVPSAAANDEYISPHIGARAVRLSCLVSISTRWPVRHAAETTLTSGSEWSSRRRFHVELLHSALSSIGAVKYSRFSPSITRSNGPTLHAVA